MTGKELREALRSGRRVYGTAITSQAPRWPEAVREIGVDFVFIDTEHIPIDRYQLSWMCQTYRAMGFPPLVRIPSPDPYLACQVIDGGACSAISPYLETPEEAVILRGAVKFRPLKGKRLDNILHGREELEPELSAFLAKVNANNLLILNIESTPAIAALDDILDVPDVDAVLIGPHDLSCNVGVPEQFTHPRFIEAATAILHKARARNIGAGIHFSGGLQLDAFWAREGMNLIIHSSDIAAFNQGVRRDLREFREALGDVSSPGAGPGGPVV